MVTGAPGTNVAEAETEDPFSPWIPGATVEIAMSPIEESGAWTVFPGYGLYDTIDVLGSGAEKTGKKIVRRSIAMQGSARNLTTLIVCMHSGRGTSEHLAISPDLSLPRTSRHVFHVK